MEREVKKEDLIELWNKIKEGMNRTSKNKEDICHLQNEIEIQKKRITKLQDKVEALETPFRVGR